MPKRMVDGDALWTSVKLEGVSLKCRAEYAWLLPLAQVNGCFECNPKLIHRTCYSQVREDWTLADVTAMLDKFEKAKMLFRWKVDGKTYGFFVGGQLEGRLPGLAERGKYRAPWNVGMVNAKELASFLGLSISDVSERYRGLLADVSKRNRRTSLRGNGIGLGLGEVGVLGMVESKAAVLGEGDASLSITARSKTPSPITPSLQANTTTPQKPTPPPTPSAPFDIEAEDELEAEDRVPVEQSRDNQFLLNLTARGFASLFRLLMHGNSHSTVIPGGWCDMWEKDFKHLLDSLSNAELLDILAVSQLPKNQPFYIRPLKLVENLELLQTMVAERQKAMGTIRAEFKGTFRALEAKHGFTH